jgi:uncharacterized pyridoxamine 5'-phosphate oxidase family protein
MRWWVGRNVFKTNPHIKMCTHSTNYVLLLENTVVKHKRIRAMVFNALPHHNKMKKQRCEFEFHSWRGVLDATSCDQV